jgi:uncharacterized linocin/CFP29 family protein
MEPTVIGAFDPLQAGVQAALAKRPYINSRGQAVVAVHTGKLDPKTGMPIMKERIVANATLRKDEWISLDDRLVESARERLVIVDDLMSAGLVHPVGGLGVMTSEWEEGSEITDAEVTMDGETQTDNDRQEFSLKGVPIPIIQKRFRIGERVLLASRQRGAALDVSTGVEAARSVARVSEDIVFNGTVLGAQKSAGNTYQVYGLTNFPQRATVTISDWSDDSGVSPEDILDDIHAMVQEMETNQRHYGPFNFYIPAAYMFRFREDFKANSDKTLLQRCLEEESVASIKVADKLATGNVVMVELDEMVIDLAVASDITNIQWASGSGWTNYFQTYAAWAPRLKTDYDGRTGILHATVGS